MLHNVDCNLCDLSLDLKAKNNYLLHTKQFTEQHSPGFIYCLRISLKETCPIVSTVKHAVCDLMVQIVYYLGILTKRIACNGFKD
jgi:hypothetical protein